MITAIASVLNPLMEIIYRFCGNFGLTIILFTLLKWAPVSRHYLMSHPWVVLFWSFVASVGAIIPSMWVQEMMPEWPEAVQQYIDQAEAMATQLMSTTGGYAVVGLLAINLLLQNLASRNMALIPLIPLVALLPGLICAGILFIPEMLADRASARLTQN